MVGRVDGLRRTRWPEPKGETGFENDESLVDEVLLLCRRLESVEAEATLSFGSCAIWTIAERRFEKSDVSASLVLPPSSRYG